MSDAHESAIKTPAQLITVVILAFVVPIFIIVLLVKFVMAGNRPAPGSEVNTAQAVEARIKPVASIEIRDPNAPRALKAGADVYKATCAACHDTGAANAPKLGDAAAWAPRIKSGFDALLASALKGKGAMPAQSGGDNSDAEVARAVVHLANAGGASFKEPAAAKPAASSAAPAAAEPVAAAPANVAPAAAAVPVATAAVPVAAAKPAGANAKAVYDASCAACHASGAAGAPKYGDKSTWAKYLKESVDELVADGIKGKGAMPPKGGRADLSDADFRAVVEYMLAAVK